MSDLLAHLQSARSEEEREWLVMRFSLDSLDPAVREAVWAAAIPRWFDQKFLAALLGQPDDASFSRMVEKLLTCSFVETFPGRGYNLHERTRALLLKQLWEYEKPRYRKLNRSAADYCSHQDASDPQWRVAELYHLLLADEDPDLEQFIQQGIEWKNQFQYATVEALVRPLIIESEANRVNPQAAAWAYLLQGRSDGFYSRYEAAKSNLKKSLDLNSENPILRAETLYALGNVCYMLDEYDDARQFLEEGQALNQKAEAPGGEANCLVVLGQIDRILRLPEAAQEKFNKALNLFQQVNDKLGEAISLNSLGELDSALGEHRAAIQKFEDALQRYREAGSSIGEANCYLSLALNSRLMGEYDNSRRLNEEALSLFRRLDNKQGEANSIWALGILYKTLNANEEAKALAEQALVIYLQIGDRLGAEQSLALLKSVSEIPED